jgi:hypothetical protein
VDIWRGEETKNLEPDSGIDSIAERVIRRASPEEPQNASIPDTIDGFLIELWRYSIDKEHTRAILIRIRSGLSRVSQLTRVSLTCRRGRFREHIAQ